MSQCIPAQVFGAFPKYSQDQLHPAISHGNLMGPQTQNGSMLVPAFRTRWSVWQQGM